MLYSHGTCRNKCMHLDVIYGYVVIFWRSRVGKMSSLYFLFLHPGNLICRVVLCLSKTFTSALDLPWITKTPLIFDSFKHLNFKAGRYIRSESDDGNSQLKLQLRNMSLLVCPSCFRGSISKLSSFLPPR